MTKKLEWVGGYVDGQLRVVHLPTRTEFNDIPTADAWRKLYNYKLEQQSEPIITHEEIAEVLANA